MKKKQTSGAVGELKQVFRALRKIFLYIYLPVWALLIALHYPYDTDASVANTAAAERESGAASFYEAAYRPTENARRGIDYEETARAAAEAMDVEGRVRAFVEQYGLHDKRVLDIGSGRGYLQDIVDDYTGLDLSSKVAPYYHKPFVEGSATAMPFEDNSFDAAWTVWVVEHIPEPQKAFREMRRVIKPGGVLFLMVAWNCTPWAADGFEVRPYEDFTLAGKLVKASIPARRSPGFTLLHQLPTRAIRRAHYAWSGKATSLRFRALEPNYDVYWQADSDAAVSIDGFEALLWFQSRGDTCLNCDSAMANWLSLDHPPFVIRVSK